MPFKMGRKPAIRTLRSLRLAIATAKVLDPLGPPPDRPNRYIETVKVDCPMFGNDMYSDCVCADTAHMLMIRSANVGMPIIPSIDDVLSLYTATTDPPFTTTDPSTDNGEAEVTMLDYLRHKGFMGHKLNSYGNIDPSNFDHLKWAVQLFGGCRLGVYLTQAAMDQFEANEPWDVTGDMNILGGHDVPIVDYDPQFFYVTTWGRWRHPVTPAWLLRFCEEAHPELAFDWIVKQGVSPGGFDISELEKRIKMAMAVPDVAIA